MRAAVIVFPGSNCDRDLYEACARHGIEPVYVWHGESAFPAVDVVFLPGGFSYGDYLRPGAIARLSPVMEAVKAFARAGGMVVGICNGFQVLCEAGMLPGALLRNAHQRFVCKDVMLRLEHPSDWPKGTPPVIRLPIAHADGRYYVPPSQLKQMEAAGQILFRYSTPSGDTEPAVNPNGSVGAVAGVCNRSGNVIGMMPHPERAADPRLGKTHGSYFFQRLIEHVQRIGK